MYCMKFEAMTVTQRVHDIKMMSYQHRIDIDTTSFWHQMLPGYLCHLMNAEKLHVNFSYSSTLANTSYKQLMIPNYSDC